MDSFEQKLLISLIVGTFLYEARQFKSDGETIGVKIPLKDIPDEDSMLTIFIFILNNLFTLSKGEVRLRKNIDVVTDCSSSDKYFSIICDLYEKIPDIQTRLNVGRLQGTLASFFYAFANSKTFAKGLENLKVLLELEADSICTVRETNPQAKHYGLIENKNISCITLVSDTNFDALGHEVYQTFAPYLVFKSKPFLRLFKIREQNLQTTYFVNCNSVIMKILLDNPSVIKAFFANENQACLEYCEATRTLCPSRNISTRLRSFFKRTSAIESEKSFFFDDILSAIQTGDFRLAKRVAVKILNETFPRVGARFCSNQTFAFIGSAKSTKRNHSAKTNTKSKKRVLKTK